MMTYNFSSVETLGLLLLDYSTDTVGLITDSLGERPSQVFPNLGRSKELLRAWSGQRLHA